MGSHLTCGHTLRVDNMYREGKYFRCCQCRRDRQTAQRRRRGIPARFERAEQQL